MAPQPQTACADVVKTNLAGHVDVEGRNEMGFRKIFPITQEYGFRVIDKHGAVWFENEYRTLRVDRVGAKTEAIIAKGVGHVLIVSYDPAAPGQAEVWETLPHKR